MPDLTYVTHCGLYCRLCGHMARMPKQARALRDSRRKEGWEDWGEHAQEGFGEFWRVLGKLAETDETCPGCRGGCGFPGCEIRVCAREREVEVCPMCEDFPCEHIHGLARSYPTLISDGYAHARSASKRGSRSVRAHIGSPTFVIPTLTEVRADERHAEGASRE